MSARCAVCGAIGSAKPLTLVSGATVGAFCVGECTGLGWESHFLRAVRAPAHELAELAWRWRRHVAATKRIAFTEPAPVSPGERLLNQHIALNGWADIAKELS